MTRQLKKGKRLLVKPVALFVIGVLGFVLVIYFSGTDQIDAILHVKLVYILMAFVALVGLTLVSTLRWAIVSNSLIGTRSLTFRQYYSAIVTSRVLGLFLPRSGSEAGIPMATLMVVGNAAPEKAAASVVLDKLFDLTLLLCWIIPALLILPGILSPVEAMILLSTATAAAVIFMFHLSSVMRIVASALSWVFSNIGGPGQLRRFCENRASNLQSLAAEQRLSRKRTLVIVGLTVLRYVLAATHLYLIAEALGLEISLYTFLLASSVMQLSLLAAITPGGLGIVEAGAVGTLALASVPSEEVAAFLVGQRAFQYVSFPILGVFSYLALLFGSQEESRAKIRTPSFLRRSKPVGG